jgi:hypothetical protein
MSNIAPKTTALRVVPKTVSEPPKAEPPKRQRRKRSQPLYLQFEEIERLFIVIESPRDRAIFRLGITPAYEPPRSGDSNCAIITRARSASSFTG